MLVTSPRTFILNTREEEKESGTAGGNMASRKACWYFSPRLISPLHRLPNISQTREIFSQTITNFTLSTQGRVVQRLLRLSEVSILLLKSVSTNNFKLQFESRQSLKTKRNLQESTPITHKTEFRIDANPG